MSESDDSRFDNDSIFDEDEKKELSLENNEEDFFAGFESGNGIIVEKNDNNHQNKNVESAFDDVTLELHGSVSDSVIENKMTTEESAPDTLELFDIPEERFAIAAEETAMESSPSDDVFDLFDDLQDADVVTADASSEAAVAPDTLELFDIPEESFAIAAEETAMESSPSDDVFDLFDDLQDADVVTADASSEAAVAPDTLELFDIPEERFAIAAEETAVESSPSDDVFDLFDDLQDADVVTAEIITPDGEFDIFASLTEESAVTANVTTNDAEEQVIVEDDLFAGLADTEASVTTPDLLEATMLSDDDLVDVEPDAAFADLMDSPFAETAVVSEPEVLADVAEMASVNAATEVPAGKGKKEKKAKKEKPVKEKKVKEPKAAKEPREKIPMNLGSLLFFGGCGFLVLLFLAINGYAVMSYGIGMGVLMFLAIFDLLALMILAIPLAFRMSKKPATDYDIGIAIATSALIICCMFMLACYASYQRDYVSQLIDVAKNILG